MDRGREDLRLGGEARRKEEAKCQKGKQLGRNRKSVGRGSRTEEVAVPAAKPTATHLRNNSHSPKGKTFLQTRHRCFKVQMLKSAAISMPFPTTSEIAVIYPLGLRPEKNDTMKMSTILTTFSDSDKTCKSPHVENWRCSLLLLFHFIVGRIKVNIAEAFFAQTVGTLILISSHWSPKLRIEKKTTWGQKQGCKKLRGCQYWGVISHLVSPLTLQYSNPLRILLKVVFCHLSKVEAIPLFSSHLYSERGQLTQSFWRNMSHIPPETSREEMDSYFFYF